MKTTYYRYWCSTCKNWELFFTKENTKFCKKCNTELDENVKYKDIPDDKLIEQRERYKKTNNKFFKNIYTKTLLGVNDVDVDFFSEVGSSYKIIEHDAGQKDIDKLKREESEKRYQEHCKKKEEATIEVLKYKDLKRNDICICGSNKKYKKCCLNKINELIYNFNL